MDKKTEVITVRITKEQKAKLQKIAQDKEWTISKTAEKAIQEWIQEREISL